LEAIHNAGYINEVIWIYKNQSIIYLECPDDRENGELDALLRQTDVCKKWDITVNPWLASGFTACQKVFDLRQQISGGLRQD